MKAENDPYKVRQGDLWLVIKKRGENYEGTHKKVGIVSII